MTGPDTPPTYDAFVRHHTVDLRCRRTRFLLFAVWIVDAADTADPYLSDGFPPVIVLWGDETRARRRAHRRWRGHLRRARTELSRDIADVVDHVHRQGRKSR